jgi:RNA polymerase sigma-70 factor, ECF subfamily
VLNDVLGFGRFAAEADHEDEVARARQRDPETWSLWYERYHRLLYRYVLVRLGDTQEAEDIASQVFVVAIDKIGSFNYRGKSVLAWLYTIARNLITDRQRINSRQGSNKLNLVEQERSIDTDEGLDLIQLRMALSRIKKEQQEVLELRFILALSIKETAAALGKSEPAVNSLQVRAITALRRQLVETQTPRAASRTLASMGMVQE